MVHTKTIVITGDKGVGKTTLVKKVIQRSKKNFYGILSERFEKGYFIQDLKTGEKMISCSEECIGFKFRKYYFDPEALEFIRRSLKRTGDILVYDEIGYLEMEKVDIWDLLQGNALLIVRKDLVPVVSSRFRAEIFEVTKENREDVVNIILERIRIIEQS